MSISYFDTIGTGAAVLRYLRPMRGRRCASPLSAPGPIGEIERSFDTKDWNNMRPKYYWEEHYEAAVLESADTKLPNLLRAAKSAIDGRLHEFQLNHGGTFEERQAITQALHQLSVLRDRVPPS